MRAGPVVFFEAPHRIKETLGPDRPARREPPESSIARELTKAHEEFVRGPIDDVIDRLPTALLGSLLLC